MMCALRFRCTLGLLALFLSSSLPAAEPTLRSIPVVRPERSDRVSFQREVLPVLQENCLPCHNQTRAKADLILETPETMLKGAESGPVLVPGDPAASVLLQAAAHELEDSVMPPPDNKANARDLTPEELGLLALWIEQGAHAGSVTAAILDWQPFPTNVVSSFAVALTGEGHDAAVARANRVSVYDAKSGRVTGQLTDPKLGGAAQRDWVNALVFSPDGEQLAAAGFREVRLWKRQPVMTQTAWAMSTGVPWVAAGFSPNRSELALITADGRLEIRDAKRGNIIRSRICENSPVVHLAWSPDAQWLALSGTNDVIQLVPMEGPGSLIIQKVDGVVAALAWFDRGRQIAVALEGTHTIQTWQLTNEKSLERGLDRVGPSVAITALVGEPGAGGSFVSGGADGMVCRWFPDATAAPREIQLEGSILRLEAVGPGERFAAALAGGGTAVVYLGETPKVAGIFGGDPRLSRRQWRAESEFALSRAEFALAGAQIGEAETAAKKGEETLMKAREKREEHAGALADKESELARQREIEAAATQERDEITAELQRVAAATREADRALEEARARAKQTAELDGAAQVAASAAIQLRSELERLLASLPESEPGGAAGKAREAATLAAAEAASRNARRSEARATAESAREALEARAFEAGQRRAESDRAQADLPPRKKEAEERLALAQKAIPGLQTQTDKARITLDGSTRDVALAEKSVTHAATVLADAKAAEEAARKRIADTESMMQEMQSEMARVASLPLADFASTPSGNALLTLNSGGLACRWDVDSGFATASSLLHDAVPLAVAALDEHEFLVVFSNMLSRVDTARPWTLERTIGDADAASGPGLFVDRVNALAFSPDGELLATGGGEPSRAGELKLWRVADGELARDLGEIHSDTVMAVAFSPRGQWLASGGADRFARVSSVSGDEPQVNLEGHIHHVLGVAWQADGSTLATAGADGVVKLWNPKTGERRKNVEGFDKEVTGLKPVGFESQFVAVSGSGQGRVFKSDGTNVRDLAGAANFLQALAVTRDGSVAAAAGSDGILRIWDVATGEQRLSLSPE